jgi:flavin reductase (DIM6/NTAB) family NADH-FMN oxidoreductase RutF
MSQHHTSKLDFISIDPGSIDTSRLHQYLLSAVAPRPIAFVSTMDKEGRVNLSPFSYFNVFGANPPLLIFSPARKVKDNTLKHTLENVKENPEAVINMVDYGMVEQMSLASTEYEKGVNEFIKAGLTQLACDRVKVPRVAESPVSFECKVIQVLETGEGGGAGNLVLCEVIRIHIRETVTTEDGMIDPLQLDLVGRMGGSWYTRTSEDSLFEIPKPLRTRGIGVDSLPEHARFSDLLTGNNLGRLGNSERIPTREEVEKARKDAQEWLDPGAGLPENLRIIHKKVRELLSEGRIQEALAWVWLGNDYVR